MTDMSIAGLLKPAVLAALVNAGHPVGMGSMDPNASQIITEAEAAEILNGGTFATPYTGQPMHVDWLYGRPIHVDLSQDTIKVDQYDNSFGEGAAAAAIAHLRTA